MSVSNEINIQVIYNDIKQQLDGIVGMDKLSLENVVSTVIQLMKYINKYESISGKDKKNAILSILAKYVSDRIDEEFEADTTITLRNFIETILPTLIDTFISLDKKELTIQDGKKLLLSCIACVTKK